MCFQMAFSYDTLVESAATTATVREYDRAKDKEEEEGKEDGEVEAYLQTMAEILETDRGNDTAQDQGYRRAIETALARVSGNKKEMCLTVKDNNFARNIHFLLKYSKQIVMQQQNEEKEEEERQVGEEKQGSGVDPRAVHEMRKVLQGKTSDYWRCAALGSEISPEVNCYDRRRRLVAVRRLRIFTVVVPCTSRPSSLVSTVQPAALSMLIIRQAISDEIRFRESLWRPTRRVLLCPVCPGVTPPPPACTSLTAGQAAWWQLAPHWTRLPRKIPPIRARKLWTWKWSPGYYSYSMEHASASLMAVLVPVTSHTTLPRDSMPTTSTRSSTWKRQWHAL